VAGKPVPAYAQSLTSERYADEALMTRLAAMGEGRL
jgi:hypothetical protein